MQRLKILIVSGMLIIVDSVCVYVIFHISTIIRNFLSPFINRPPLTWDAVNPIMQLFLLVIIGIFVFQKIYPGYGLPAIKEFEKIGVSVSFSFLFLGALSYLIKSFHIFPRSIFPIAWLLLFFTIPVVHFLVRNLLSRIKKIYGTPVVVFGEGKWAEEIVQSLKFVRRLGWRPQALYPLEDKYFEEEFKSSSVCILATKLNEKVPQYIRKLNKNFRNIILVQDSSNIGSLCVETRDLNSHLGLEFHYQLLGKGNRIFKRIIDIFGSLFLLVILSPLLLLLSILIKLDSHGPVIYKQERLGKDLKKFQVVKFRTMIVDAEQKLIDILENDPTYRAEYDEYHKLKSDPRVTRFGQFLRKFSLDELPQLWNVLKGEMSLIGPRAYMTIELEKIGNYASTILRVAPGMSGWWQVLGRNNTSFTQRLHMDEYYISNWSLWMDLYVLLRTFWVVISGEGV